MAFAPPAFAQTSVEWVQVGGPFRVKAATAGTASNPLCVHGLGCTCPGAGSYCGKHRNGTEVEFWKDGCNRPAITIKCVVRTAGAPTPLSRRRARLPGPRHRPLRQQRAEIGTGIPESVGPPGRDLLAGLQRTAQALHDAEPGSELHAKHLRHASLDRRRPVGPLHRRRVPGQPRAQYVSDHVIVSGASATRR